MIRRQAGSQTNAGGSPAEAGREWLRWILSNYDFEWDPAKALFNARKHDVTLDQAATVFLDALALTVFDRAYSREETAATCLRGRTTIGETMTTAITQATGDDEMPDEIDFSGGTRGKFHRPNPKLNFPAYLDTEQSYLSVMPARRGVPLSELANELLKNEIAIIEAEK